MKNTEAEFESNIVYFLLGMFDPEYQKEFGSKYSKKIDDYLERRRNLKT